MVYMEYHTAIIICSAVVVAATITSRRLTALTLAGMIMFAACADDSQIKVQSAGLDSEDPSEESESDVRTDEQSETGTRRNPLALGSEVVVSEESGSWIVSILDVNLDADDVIAAENRLNDLPEDGRRFVLVGVSARFRAPEEAPDSARSLMRDVDFTVAGPSAVGVTFISCEAAIPDELNYTAEVFDGGTITGNLCFKVPIGDAIPELLIRVAPPFCLDCSESWYRLSPT